MATCSSSCFSAKHLLVLFVISAIPIGYLISLETAKPANNVYEYYSPGWMRECSKWDDVNSRFIVSFFDGGMGIVPIDPGESAYSAKTLEEIQVVKDADLAGNATLGFTIDRPRNRVVACIADVLGNRYSALAAYNMTTWKRLFLTRLSGPGTFTYLLLLVLANLTIFFSYRICTFVVRCQNGHILVPLLSEWSDDAVISTNFITRH